MLAHLRADADVCKLGGSIVLPNDEAASALRAAGWRQVTTEYRRARPYRIYLKRAGGVAALLNAAFSPTERWLRNGARRRSKHVAGEWEWQWQPSVTFDMRFDRLWDELPKQGRVIAVRNAAYLTWRYARHPATRYELLEVTQRGQLRAYALISVHDRIVSVTDFVCANAIAARYLRFAVVARWADDVGIDAVQVRMTEPSWMTHEFHTRSGFMRRKDQVPVLWNDGAANDANPLSNKLSAGDWFLTWGDKDI
jgi:hypothetical protein